MDKNPIKKINDIIYYSNKTIYDTLYIIHINNNKNQRKNWIKIIYKCNTNIGIINEV